MHISNEKISPALLAALELTSKHIEPAKALLEPAIVPSSVPSGARAFAYALPISTNAKKLRLRRKRNKLAAASRKRNRR